MVVLGGGAVVRATMAELVLERTGLVPDHLRPAATYYYCCYCCYSAPLPSDPLPSAGASPSTLLLAPLPPLPSTQLTVPSPPWGHVRHNSIARTSPAGTKQSPRPRRSWPQQRAARPSPQTPPLLCSPRPPAPFYVSGLRQCAALPHDGNALSRLVPPVSRREAAAALLGPCETAGGVMNVLFEELCEVRGGGALAESRVEREWRRSCSSFARRRLEFLHPQVAPPTNSCLLWCPRRPGRPVSGSRPW